MPRCGDLLDRNQAALVDAPEVTGPDILQNLGPLQLRLTGDHRIDMPQRLLKAHRGVDAPHDHGHAPRAEAGGDLVSPRGLRGERSDADKIRAGHALVLHRTQVLVDHLDLPLRRGQAREDQQTERLPHPAAVQPAPSADIGEADDGIARVDQMDSHCALYLPPSPTSLMSLVDCRGLENDTTLESRSKARPGRSGSTLHPRPAGWKPADGTRRNWLKQKEDGNFGSDRLKKLGGHGLRRR